MFSYFCECLHATIETSKREGRYSTYMCSSLVFSQSVFCMFTLHSDVITWKVILSGQPYVTGTLYSGI